MLTLQVGRNIPEAYALRTQDGLKVVAKPDGDAQLFSQFREHQPLSVIDNHGKQTLERGAAQVQRILTEAKARPNTTMPTLQQSKENLEELKALGYVE